jgi:hypothetical protein
VRVRLDHGGLCALLGFCGLWKVGATEQEVRQVVVVVHSAIFSEVGFAEYTQITVSKQSWMWIKRFATELKSQSLMINQLYGKQIDIVLLGVSNVRGLRINYGLRIPKLPIGLQSLHMHSCSLDDCPHFPPIKTCCITGDTSENDIEILLHKLPKTLEDLLTPWFVLPMLPSFPNLTTLEIDQRGWFSIDLSESILGIQCPALSTLILRCNILSLESLRGIKLRLLVIKTFYHFDVSPLSDAFIEELDLTECPNLTGLSKFPNVKTIKT